MDSTLFPNSLHAERLALVVVDMQYFDAHPDWGEGKTARSVGVLDAFNEYFEALDAAIPRIQTLLSVCRTKGIEVVHVRVAELTEDSRDVGRRQIVRGLAVPHQSKEAAFLDEVAPRGDEIVISKSSSSAFTSGSLDRVLRNMGIDTLVFAGTSTTGCVESSASDAADLGYTVIVASDGCACSTRRSHLSALQRMARAGTHIGSVDAIVAAVTGLPPVDRVARSGVARAEAYHAELTAYDGPGDSPYRLIFGPAVRLSLAPSSTALLIIDAQPFFGDPTSRLAVARGSQVEGHIEAAYYECVRSVVPNIARLLGSSRSAGLLIVFVRTVAHAPDGRDLSPRIRKLGVVPVVGDNETEILPELAPRRGEVVLTKPAAGVCTGTGLDELLRNAGITTIIVTGISYDGAIEGSIRSLADRGYGVVVVPDACAAFTAASREQLASFESGITNVLPTAAVVGRLAELEPAASE